MKKLFLPLIAVTMFFAACSKDQRAVNKLEGSWKITSATYNGVAEADSTYSGIITKFEDCNAKDNDCAGSVTEDGKSFPFTYKVTDKGETLTITMSILGLSETTVSKISDLEKDKFVSTTTEGSDVIVQTYEKID